MTATAPALQALLFDVDGTLADTEEVHRLAFDDAFEAHGLPYRWSRAEYACLLGVSGGKERLRHYFESLDVSADDHRALEALVPALHATKNTRYAELFAGTATLRPGVVRLLDEARAAGIRVGIASTTSLHNALALLEATLGKDGAARFDVIACGDVVSSKKPSPDIYLFALAHLGMSAVHAVAFEDSENGLRAARGAGLFTVITPSPWSGGHDLAAADLFLPHLGDPAEPLDASHSFPFLTVAWLEAALAARGAKPIGAGGPP